MDDATPAFRWWESIGAPRYVAAPMVGASDLPFRRLLRRHGAQLCFSAMADCALICAAADAQDRLGSTSVSAVSETEEASGENIDVVTDPSRAAPARSNLFLTSELGGAATRDDDDWPLVLQVAASEPAVASRGVDLLLDHVLATCGPQGLANVVCVDLNLGCPQPRALRGDYGAFLAEDADRAVAVLAAVGEAVKQWEKRARCSFPATRFFANGQPRPEIVFSCKIRVFGSTKRTVSLATRLAATGISLLTVHGRTRLQMHALVRARGQLKFIPANMDAVRAVREALPAIPVLSNGNVRTLDDVHARLTETGADGVMAARTLLSYPGLFGGLVDNEPRLLPFSPPQLESSGVLHRVNVAEEYLALLPEASEVQGNGVPIFWIQAHMRKLLLLPLEQFGLHTRLNDCVIVGHVQSLLADLRDLMEQGVTPVDFKRRCRTETLEQPEEEDDISFEMFS
jgi:tRNA-dihydrouridine synthase 1